MHIISLTGGLGNQLFQYAFARAYALHNRCAPVLIDTRYYSHCQRGADTRHCCYQLQHFRTLAQLASDEQVQQLVARLNCRLRAAGAAAAQRGRAELNIIEQPQRSGCYAPELLAPRRDAYIRGYFQCEDYALPWREVLLGELALCEEPDPPNRQLLRRIRHCPAVAVHVRRGDYVRLANLYPACSLHYYRAAFSLMAERVAHARFFVFSDDLPAAMAMLQGEGWPLTAVDCNRTPQRSHLELELMRNCAHHIIANSTFSWWGAWLANSPRQLVVAPYPWFAPQLQHQFRDLLPRRWLRLDRCSGAVIPEGAPRSAGPL